MPTPAQETLLGRVRDNLSNVARALRAPIQHSELSAPLTDPYPFQPKNLREAFDSIPGGGPARTRQFSRNVDSWASTWDMLSRANRSIDTTYFIVERDIFGYSYLGNLLHHQRQGRQVRFMTDATADYNGKNGFTSDVTFTWPPEVGGKDYLRALVNAGGEVAIYHPVWQHLLKAPEAALLGASSIAATNHDKILVVDGMISKTGGRNIARDYFADPADYPEAWRDGDSENRGEPQAAAMTRAFEREFKSRAASTVWGNIAGDWTPRDIELLGAYHLMDIWMHEPPLSPEEATALRGDNARRSAMAAQLVERAIAKLPAEGITRAVSQRERESLTRMANEMVGYTRTRGASVSYDREAHFTDAEVKIVDQTSVLTPDPANKTILGPRFNEIAPALTALVRGAQDRIVIENPYVVLTEMEIRELEKASARGVEIWFGTNSPLSTDSSVTQAFFLEDWAYILARVPTARFFVATGSHKFHDKMAVIDNTVSAVMSYNADWLSAYVNSEIGDITWSPERAQHLLADFKRDYEDPGNGVLEYKIKRNADGSAVLVDRNAGTGQPPNWQPVVEFGPENHLPPKIIEEYKKRRKSWNGMRRDLQQLAPLQRPPLTFPAPTPGRSVQERR